MTHGFTSGPGSLYPLSSILLSSFPILDTSHPRRVPPPAYRCIAFDAVGTLIRPVPSPGEVYYRVAREFGSRLSPEEIARRFHRVFRDVEHADRLAAADGGCVTDEVREKE